MTSIEWYYVDVDGKSKGPIATADVKELPMDVFVWNGINVNVWTELKDLQSLLFPNIDRKTETQCHDTDTHTTTVNAVKPKLTKYWSISTQLEQNYPDSPSIQVANVEYDYMKCVIPQNNANSLIKSNLSQQLQNKPIPKKIHKPKTVNIKQSVTDNVGPPTFSANDVISDKLEQIMDTLQIAEHARFAMRQWTEEKKLQMILQYDFKHKTDILTKKKNMSKKRKSLLKFKKGNKKKGSMSNKRKNKDWQFGFNPLPLPLPMSTEPNSKQTKESDKEQIMDTITDAMLQNQNVIFSKNELNKKGTYTMEEQKHLSEISVSNEDTQDSEQFMSETAKQRTVSVTEDYENSEDSFDTQKISIFNVISPQMNGKSYDTSVASANTISVQHDYLHQMDGKNVSSIGGHMNDEMLRESD